MRHSDCGSVDASLLVDKFFQSAGRVQDDVALKSIITEGVSFLRRHKPITIFLLPLHGCSQQSKSEQSAVVFSNSLPAWSNAQARLNYILNYRPHEFFLWARQAHDNAVHPVPLARQSA